MNFAWLVAIGFFVQGAGAQRTDAPKQRSLHPGPKVSANTACAACHVTASWTEVRFDHDRTGFPLKGRHAVQPCKACHTVDFTSTLPRACTGCHVDPHEGELGARCEGCHQESSWKSAFTADAHRATNFPLVGRHALLPCESCHAETATRRFSRATTECVGCHQRDYDRTAMIAINHQTLGFGLECRQCHGMARFAPAIYPGHDACYVTSRGKHAGLPCLSCHSTLPMSAAVGTCNTGTAACTACHDHECAKSDSQHLNVAGYQCRDRKCYECHQATVTP